MAVKSPWVWEGALKRYRNTESGRFIGARGMIELRDTFNTAQTARTADIAARFANGELTAGQWTLEMRTVVKETYIDQYVMARGGRGQMTQADFGRIGQMVREQYKYLQGFEADLKAGKLSAGQIATRAGMYVDSGTQAFERGHAAAFGMPQLPAYPGDGATQCRCITSGESRVLTARGNIALLDVCIGDLVLTHRGRWRPVVGVSIKPSEVGHQQYWVRAGGGGWIGCTDTHRWLTSGGWLASSDICNSSFVCYNANHENTQDLLSMRSASQQSLEAHALPDVSSGMSLRELERFAGGRVPIMRQVTFGQTAMAGTTSVNSRRVSACWLRATAALRRFVRNYEVAGQVGWARLRVLLAGWQAPIHLSVSMALAESAWQHSAGPCDPSQRRGRDERRIGEFGVATQVYPCNPARSASARRGGNQVDNEDLSCLREGVFSRRPQGQGADLLHAGMLSPGTKLYDIEVAEDHSFVIEGLVSHNTNCKCSWEIIPVEGGWDCFWRLGNAEHCQGCVTNNAHWDPLELRP